MSKKKIARVTTVSKSLKKLLGPQINYIKKYHDVMLISQDESGGLTELGREMGLPYFPVNLTRKITPLQDLYALFQLTRLFIRTKPDIVHSHTPKAGLIAMIAAKLSGVKNRWHMVAGMPLLETSGLKYRLLVMMERLTYRCATTVYFNSIGLMKIVSKRGIYSPKNKFKVLGNGATIGVDCNLFSKASFTMPEESALKTEIGISNDTFVYIFIGRLVGDKGLNELVHSFLKINSEFDNVKLLLLGRFEEELDPLKKITIDAINDTPNIIHLGYQNDVRPYLAISNLFVFPSYREGFPNVVMQAGAMSLPSIVSDINGNNEIIEHNYNGLIVEVKDQEALFLAMKKCLTEPQNNKIMGENARQVIKDKFDQKLLMQLMLEDYNNA